MTFSFKTPKWAFQSWDFYYFNFLEFCIFLFKLILGKQPQYLVNLIENL